MSSRKSPKKKKNDAEDDSLLDYLVGSKNESIDNKNSHLDDKKSSERIINNDQIADVSLEIK